MVAEKHLALGGARRMQYADGALPAISIRVPQEFLKYAISD